MLDQQYYRARPSQNFELASNQFPPLPTGPSRAEQVCVCVCACVRTYVHVSVGSAAGVQQLLVACNLKIGTSIGAP